VTENALAVTVRASALASSVSVVVAFWPTTLIVSVVVDTLPLPSVTV
jgi:hypothetical protein